MFSEPVISLTNLSKCYQIYDKPRDRLLQMIVRHRRQYFREFWALKNIDLVIKPGEVIGIIGQNGAGKSTLLQLVCGTLNQTSGDITVKGRIAALLELGAGFNPEFTGRENVYLSATLSGLTTAEINDTLEDIINFSGIRKFIDQPVKTYSSGMYVRLAFSVAINVDPDILVIDEALSVGDGDFARRSFDRIMALKNAGKTILFCSHSLYQIDAICTRALWLDSGEVKIIDQPSKVIEAYSNFLNSIEVSPQQVDSTTAEPETSSADKVARITQVTLTVDGIVGTLLEVQSGKSNVAIKVNFTSDPQRPAPSVAICFIGVDGKGITSAGTHVDHVVPQRECNGSGVATVTFPKFSLLRGKYHVDVYLFCESGIHIYDSAIMTSEISVSQSTVEVGVVRLPHTWEHTDDVT